jgi:hypothetical protein
MPGKSKRSKNKRYQQIKKTANAPRPVGVSAPTAAATVLPSTTASVASKANTPSAVERMNQYTYIPGDLKRIGILSAIIIVILFVLYFILT